MDPKIPVVILQIFLGFIAIFAFLIGFGYFTFFVQNYTAAIGFIFSAFITLIGVHLNVLIFRRQLDHWYDPSSQDSLQVFAIFTASVSFVASGYSLSRAIVNYEEWWSLDSWYISAGSSAICFLLSCWLYGLTRWTRRFIELCDPSLLAPLRRSTYRFYS